MTTYTTEEYVFAALAVVGFVSVAGFAFSLTSMDEDAYDLVEEEWKKLTGR